jgi:hypothetical protein
MVTKEKHYTDEACCSRETSRPRGPSVLTSWPCSTSEDHSPNNYIDTSPHSETPDAGSPILSEAFSQPVRPHAESTLSLTKHRLPSKDDIKPMPTAQNSPLPEVSTPDSPPVHARLVAGGISVTYRAPAPPLITPADVPILHYDHEEEEEDGGDGYRGAADAELAAFLARVKSASPLATRRSDTSSASLPVSPWLSSRDSLLLALSSPGGGGAVGGHSCSDGDEDDGRPASLTSEDFEPQIMTEDCATVVVGVSVTSSPSHFLRSSSTDSVASSTRTAGSSASSGGQVYYSPYIPDREVVIVENEFTRFQPAPSVLLGSGRSSAGTSSEVRDCHDEDKISLGYDNLEDGGGGKRHQEYYSRAWHYNSAAEMKAFWEARAGQVLIKASSESNIFEHGRQPPENGLREIPRDREYTSGEEEEEEEEEYQADELRGRSYLCQPYYEESGFYFYGYDNVIPEEPSDYEDSWTSDTARHISLIAVGHQHNNSPHSLIHIEESEEEGDLVVGQSSDENDHVTVISVEPPPPVAASTNNRCHTAAVLTPTTNTTNNTPHRRVNAWAHAINNSGTAVDEERRQFSSPSPPFRCSVKDLRRMFERQAATAATFEPPASTSGGRSRGSSVPDGTVMSLSL